MNPECQKHVNNNKLNIHYLVWKFYLLTGNFYLIVQYNAGKQNKTWMMHAKNIQLYRKTCRKKKIFSYDAIGCVKDLVVR